MSAANLRQPCEAAVDAAARMSWDSCEFPHAQTWEAAPQFLRTEYLDAARHALTAALPHLRRQFVAECVEELAIYSCACGRRLEALLDAPTKEGE